MKVLFLLFTFLLSTSAQSLLDLIEIPDSYAYINFGTGAVRDVVVIAGGTINDTAPVSKVQIYNVTSKQFSNDVPNLPHPPAKYASTQAVSVQNRFVGFISSGSFVDIYDIETNTWISTNIGTCQLIHAPVALRDSVVIVCKDSYVSLINTTTSLYTNTTFMPTGKVTSSDSASATVVLDEVLLIGGGISSGVYVNVVDIFNFTSGASSTATLSVGRRSPAAVSTGRFAFFAGGGTGVPSAVVDVFEFGGASVLAYTFNLSKARLYFGAVSINGFVFFGPGTFGSNRLDVATVIDYGVGVAPNITSSSFSGITSEKYGNVLAFGNQLMYSQGGTTQGALLIGYYHCDMSQPCQNFDACKSYICLESQICSFNTENFPNGAACDNDTLWCNGDGQCMNGLCNMNDAMPCDIQSTNPCNNTCNEIERNCLVAATTVCEVGGQSGQCNSEGVCSTEVENPTLSSSTASSITSISSSSSDNETAPPTPETEVTSDNTDDSDTSSGIYKTGKSIVALICAASVFMI